MFKKIIATLAVLFTLTLSVAFADQQTNTNANPTSNIWQRSTSGTISPLVNSDSVSIGGSLNVVGGCTGCGTGPSSAVGVFTNIQLNAGSNNFGASSIFSYATTSPNNSVGQFTVGTSSAPYGNGIGAVAVFSGTTAAAGSAFMIGSSTVNRTLLVNGNKVDLLPTNTLTAIETAPIMLNTLANNPLNIGTSTGNRAYPKLDVYNLSASSAATSSNILEVNNQAFVTTPQNYLSASTTLFSVSVNGATKPVVVSNNNVSKVNTYGDSITFGASASGFDTYYTTLMGRALGYEVNNQSFGGATIEDYPYTDNLFAQPVGTTTISTMLVGYNDHRYYGTDATRLDTFTRALPVVLAYASIPDANKKFANTFGTTGTWTATTTYNKSFGIFSTNSGDTATTTVNGNVVYVAGTRFASGGTIKITVDGRDYGVYDCSGVQTANLTARNWAPFMMRVGNLSNGPHSVVLTKMSTGSCELDWAAGNEMHYSQNYAPAIYVGGALLMTTANYASDSPAGSVESNRLYNNAIQKVIKQLEADGLPVVPVETAENYDPATMVSVDNVHPSTYGHRMLANFFIKHMDGSSYAQNKQFTRFFSSYFPALTMGAGTTTTVTIDGQNGAIAIGTTTAVGKFHASAGASATTTSSFAELGVTTSKSCFNVNTAAGAAASFYFVGTTMVVEANYCR